MTFLCKLEGGGGEVFENLNVPLLVFIFFYMYVLKLNANGRVVIQPPFRHEIPNASPPPQYKPTRKAYEHLSRTSISLGLIFGIIGHHFVIISELFKCYKQRIFGGGGQEAFTLHS